MWPALLFVLPVDLLCVHCDPTFSAIPLIVWLLRRLSFSVWLSCRLYVRLFARSFDRCLYMACVLHSHCCLCVWCKRETIELYDDEDGDDDCLQFHLLEHNNQLQWNLTLVLCCVSHTHQNGSFKKVFNRGYQVQVKQIPPVLWQNAFFFSFLQVHPVTLTQNAFYIFFYSINLPVSSFSALSLK